MFLCGFSTLYRESFPAVHLQPVPETIVIQVLVPSCTRLESSPPYTFVLNVEATTNFGLQG